MKSVLPEKISNIFSRVADKAALAVATVATAVPFIATGVLGSQGGAGPAVAGGTLSAVMASATFLVAESLKDDGPRNLILSVFGGALGSIVPVAYLAETSLNLTTDIAAIAAASGSAMAALAWYAHNDSKAQPSGP